MGFFYSNNNGNKVFGYKLTIKFGKASSKEDQVEAWANRLLSALGQIGVEVKGPFDNDPNKDKHIL